MCSDWIPTILYDDQVTGIPKIAAQDTTLTVSNVNGEKTTFPVPSGTQVDLHAPGLHYNRTLVALCHEGQVLMMFDSTILERATQVHARALPWGLAQGCVHSIQSRYTFTHQRTAVIAHERSAGARACLGRRCEMLRLLESRVLINFFQVFRNRVHSRRDYAGVEV